MKPTEVCPESIGLRSGRVRVDGNLGKHNGEDSIQSQTSRIFYKGQMQSSGRVSFLSRDAIVPIFGDKVISSGRSPHFTYNALEQGK